MQRAIQFVTVSADILAHYNAGASGSPGDYPAAVLASDPVAYWRMEEMSTNVSAWAVNAVDRGALPGNYARFVSGQHANAGPRSPTFEGFDEANKAPYFQTDTGAAPYDQNYIAVSDDNSLNITGDLTLEAWIKIEQVNTNFTSHGVLAKYGTGPNWGDERAYMLGVDTATTGLWFFVSTDGTYDANNRIDIAPLALNEWRHVVAVFDAGSAMRIYTNGVEAASKTTGVPATGIFQSKSPLWIGTFANDADGNQFYGIIDEVAVYNKALSAPDVLRHYRAGVLGRPAGTVFMLR